VLVADKRLIELNVENRRLGRFDQPVDVLVEPHDPPPPMTTVPDVLQLGKKSAVAIIVAAGLTAEAHGPDRPSAWVRSQHPAGDTVVPLGSNVTLTLTTETRQ
jgi:beta-lactam-binding protein with PASTA domain